MTKKIYTCAKCGCTYLCKFQDTTLCITCAKPIHDELKQKLSKQFKEERTRTVQYAQLYKQRKSKSNVKTSKGARKRRN